MARRFMHLQAKRRFQTEWCSPCRRRYTPGLRRLHNQLGWILNLWHYLLSYCATIFDVLLSNIPWIFGRKIPIESYRKKWDRCCFWATNSDFWRGVRKFDPARLRPSGPSHRAFSHRQSRSRGPPCSLQVRMPKDDRSQSQIISYSFQVMLVLIEGLNRS